MGALPAVLAALSFLVHRHRDPLGLERLSRRGSLVIGFLVLQLLVAIATEVTSLVEQFDRGTLSLVWLSVLAVLLVVSHREMDGRLEIRQQGARLFSAVTRSTIEERFWAVAGMVWLAVLGTIAWLYRPSNGDSLVYHLARVMHWIQDASVAHYATHYLAQIELAPLHEYNLAHLHLLSGGDRLDGYIQLLAAVVAISGASEVARLLGGSRRAQVITAVLAATLPSLILEATSTQNNDFAAAIGISLLVLLLVWRPLVTPLAGTLLIGVGVGAAVLSKGTLIAFLAPVCLLLVVSSIVSEIRVRERGHLALRLAVSGVAVLGAALLVAGPFLSRNVQLFGGLTGPVSKTTISTELTPRAAVANVVRSTASNFAIGDGQGGLRTHVSRLVLRSAERLFGQFGIDPADQRYVLGTDLEAFKIRDYSYRERVEEVGANPWHVSLLAVAGGVLVIGVSRGSIEDRRRLLIAVGLAFGYVLFTATARWSIYAVRYYIPLLVAWCPLIALVLVRLRPWLSSALLLILAVACLPQLVDNTARSVLHPRWRVDSHLDPYFASAEAQNIASPSADYERLAAAISEGSCEHLGIANWILVEYPIWVGTAHEGWAGRIEAVGVKNESRALEVRDHDPCALVREVEAGYVTPDDGLANLRFGSLALSSRPPQMNRVSADAPGFGSDVSGVDVRPGGGWLLGGKTPSLVGEGTVYLTSDRKQAVRVRFLGPGRELAVTGGGRSGGTLPVAATAPDGIKVDLVVPKGTTRLRLAGPRTSGDQVPLELNAVRVAPL